MTVSDWLVRQFFHLSKNHASINAELHILQNKHNNKTNSHLLYVVLRLLKNIIYCLKYTIYHNSVCPRVYKNRVLGPRQFKKTGSCQTNDVPNLCIWNKIYLIKFVFCIISLYDVFKDKQPLPDLNYVPFEDVGHWAERFKQCFNSQAGYHQLLLCQTGWLFLPMRTPMTPL